MADGIADLAFLSMVYHHIQDKGQAIREIGRVLRHDGALCIRTSTTDCLDSYLWLRFFPDAQDIERRRMPSREEMADTLQAGGFKLEGHTVVHQFFAANLQEYFDKISLRGLSSLKSISDDAFRTGLARLESYCMEQDVGDAVYEDIDLFVFRVG